MSMLLLELEFSLVTAAYPWQAAPPSQGVLVRMGPNENVFKRSPLWGYIFPRGNSHNPITTPTLKSSRYRRPMVGGTVGLGGASQGYGAPAKFSPGVPLLGPELPP